MGSTPVAFVLWYRALARLGPERTGLFAGLMPVSAALAGAAVTATPLRTGTLIGTIVTGTGPAVGLGSGRTARGRALTDTHLRHFPGRSQPACRLQALDAGMEKAASRCIAWRSSETEGAAMTTSDVNDRSDGTPSPRSDGTSTGSGITRHDVVDPASRRPAPGTLDLSIRRRGAVIELGLAGELDMATAPRIREAMAWLRFSSDPDTAIRVDTTDIDFIAVAGYRALQAALVGPDGLWDRRVALIVGPAVARLEAAIAAASTSSRRRPVPGNRSP